MNILQQSIHKKLSEILPCPTCKGYGELSKPPYDDSVICPDCNRDWQLHQLLMVMNKINTFVFYEFDQYAEGDIKTMCLTVHITMDKDVEIKYDLTKSVLEQDEETLQKIGEIL